VRHYALTVIIDTAHHTVQEPEGDFSLDDGGWNDLAEDAPSKQFEFLYDIPNWVSFALKFPLRPFICR